MDVLSHTFPQELVSAVVELVDGGNCGLEFLSERCGSRALKACMDDAPKFFGQLRDAVQESLDAV